MEAATGWAAIWVWAVVVTERLKVAGVPGVTERLAGEAEQAALLGAPVQESERGTGLPPVAPVVAICMA